MKCEHLSSCRNQGTVILVWGYLPSMEVQHLYLCTAHIGWYREALAGDFIYLEEET